MVMYPVCKGEKAQEYFFVQIPVQARTFLRVIWQQRSLQKITTRGWRVGGISLNLRGRYAVQVHLDTCWLLFKKFKTSFSKAKCVKVGILHNCLPQSLIVILISLPLERQGIQGVLVLDAFRKWAGPYQSQATFAQDGNRDARLAAHLV